MNVAHEEAGRGGKGIFRCRTDLAEEGMGREDGPVIRNRHGDESAYTISNILFPFQHMHHFISDKYM